MNRYHINPQTGNPNVCRAKIKCRFGGDDSHYDSAEAAREVFERQEANSTIKALRKQKLSAGVKILIALDRAAQDIAFYSQKAKDENVRASVYPGWRDRVNLRNSLKDQLLALPWDATDAASYDDTVAVDFSTREFKGDEPRLGLINDAFTPDREAREMFTQLDLASAAWMARLSSAEVKALAIYNVDATGYALAMVDKAPADFEPEVAKYLHSAIAKAPRTEKPFIAYAGIDRERSVALRTQADTGTLELARLQSASANPAQVNGFMFRSDWEGPPDEVAVEFTLDRVASLSAFNINKKEMELLVPPGSYRVREKLHQVKYFWGKIREEKELSGRTAETTYVVERHE